MSRWVSPRRLQKGSKGIWQKGNLYLISEGSSNDLIQSVSFSTPKKIHFGLLKYVNTSSIIRPVNIIHVFNYFCNNYSLWLFNFFSAKETMLYMQEIKEQRRE